MIRMNKPRAPHSLLIIVLLSCFVHNVAKGEDEGCDNGLKIETTLVLLKPDAVKRGHVGAAITQFELRGLEVMELKRYDVPPPQLLAEHYKEHAHRPFYTDLIDSMSGAVVAISIAIFLLQLLLPCDITHAAQIRGEDAIMRTRELLGPTDPRLAGPRTLRGMFGLDKTRNFAHASDSMEASKREYRLWFEIRDWELAEHVPIH